MSRPKLTTRDRVRLRALKLVEVAKLEGMPYRTAQKRKDLFAVVEIPTGFDKDGKEKIKKRYLDRKTTDLLRASGLFIPKE